MTAPGHILMTADAVGGVWTYSLELARALARFGTRVTLATMGPRPSGEQRTDALRIPGLTLLESHYKLEWMDDPWTDVHAAGEWLLRVSEQLRPDVVHLNGFAHGAWHWKAPTIVVAHSCVVSWWNAVHRTDPPPEWSTYRGAVRAGLLGADAVVAVSRAMADAVSRHYGFTGAAVILNSRRSGEYQPSVKKPFILTSGRVWDSAKNVISLDRIANRLDWPVYLAGDTMAPHGTAKTIRHLRPLGRLTPQALRRWFSSASVYALPALYEPFGLSVLEAALSECALVVGDIPSLRELWGDAALFVEPHDDEAMIAALNRLSKDTVLRRELGQKARHRGLGLTPERMADEYVRVYLRARARYTTATEVATSCAS